VLSKVKEQDLINFDGQKIQVNSCDLVSKLELLIATAISRRIELTLFGAIMIDCELSWTDLYSQYVGKNVLNMFRQDNGYKEGTYKKIWDGKEDNEYLVDILISLDPDKNTFKDQIYSALQKAYPC